MSDSLTTMSTGQNDSTRPTSTLDVKDTMSATSSSSKGRDQASTSTAEASSVPSVPTSIPCQIDEVLTDALQVPRDRKFILRQEKDMEDRIRNGQEKSWELPLMNSYQRLLVHRIADHFHLAHSIDSVSKAVTLTKQDSTEIPELSLSSMAMAAMERLSEPAYTLPKEGSSSLATFKIMRREESGRSASPRTRQNLEEGGSGRDRRNMTIEEREAAYKEARLRIFGSEEINAEEASQASTTNALGDEDVRAIANLSLESESSTSSSTKSNSRKGTPGRVSPAPSSTSSSSSAAILRAGAPLFDPSSRGATPADGQYYPHLQRPAQQQQGYPYAMFDANGQPIYAYAAGYAMPMLQHDQFGRPVFAMNGPPIMSPQYSLPTPGSSGSTQEIYSSSAGPSPSASSRSTSISTDTEADAGQIAGTRSGTAESNGSQSKGQGRNGSRPSSVSPTSSFIRSVPGATHGANGAMQGPPLVYQSHGPVPPSWYPPTQMGYNGNLGGNSHPGRFGTPTPDGSSGRGLQKQPAGYAAAVLGQARVGAAPFAPGSSASMQGMAATNTSSLAFPAADALQAEFSSRGRANQAERSLFDPSKPMNGGGSSSNSSGSASNTARHPLGKSVSAAGMLESRMNGQASDGNASSSLSSDISRRVSSSSSSNHSPTDPTRRGTPPSHPSLPARPDWVLQQKARLSNANAATAISAEDSPPPSNDVSSTTTSNSS